MPTLVLFETGELDPSRPHPLCMNKKEEDVVCVCGAMILLHRSPKENRYPAHQSRARIYAGHPKAKGFFGAEYDACGESSGTDGGGNYPSLHPIHAVVR